MATDFDFKSGHILDVIKMIEDYRLDIRTVTTVSYTHLTLPTKA